MVSKVTQRSLFLNAAMFFCLFVSTFTPMHSHAALIASNFSGTVLSVNPLFSPTFSAGQTLTGLYTFESATPPQIGSNSASAFYSALTSMNFSIDGYNASASGAPGIQIESGLNGAPNDFYGVGVGDGAGLTGPDVNGFALLSFGLRLDDLTNSVFTTALALPTNLDYSDFTSSAFFLFFQNPDTLSSILALSGELTGFNVPAAIPEPCTLALLGVGLAGAALARQRRTH